MSKPVYLSVIVPVYNEAERIERCIDRLIPHAARYNCEIIFVDNGSTDNTLAMLDVAKTIYRPIRVISMAERGKGEAVKAGMLSATGRYRFMCDVDLSTPAKEIHRFLEFARQYDVVIGSREIDRSAVQASPLRRFIGRAFHKVVNGLVPGVSDTQCGFKMFRDYAAEKIFQQVTIRGMAFDVQALHLALCAGFTLKEIAVPWVNDSRSQVRLIEDSFEMLWDVARLRYHTARIGDASAPPKTAM